MKFLEDEINHNTEPAERVLPLASQKSMVVNVNLATETSQ